MASDNSEPLKGVSTFSKSMLESGSSPQFLSAEITTQNEVPNLPTTFGHISGSQQPAVDLAAELELSLDDMGYMTPRMHHEMPLVSKSHEVGPTFENQYDQGLTLGAAGIQALEPGIAGFTLDAKSSQLLVILEEEKRKQHAHQAYLSGLLPVGKDNEHYFREFDEESKGNAERFRIDDMKGRISNIEKKFPLTQQATDDKIKRYHALMEKVSSVGAQFQNAPGLSPLRNYGSSNKRQQNGVLDLGSPTRFDLNLTMDPVLSPRAKNEYRCATGDPWEEHIKTTQEKMREQRQIHRHDDERVARSLVVQAANVNTDNTHHHHSSSLHSTYRKEGIGYEYENAQQSNDEPNAFFEREYLQKIATGENPGGLKGAYTFDHFEPNGSSFPLVSPNDKHSEALPQPLASVLEEMKLGSGTGGSSSVTKRGLDLNDPPVLSPSKQELEAYLSNIPGMKRFSPREYEDGDATSNSNSMSAGKKNKSKRQPQFAHRQITESRSKEGGGAVPPELSPRQKAKAKRRVKKEVGEEQKKALMERALWEAQQFLKK